MEYIVPSIGRCGSTLLVRIIAESSGRERVFVSNINKLERHKGKVMKTHAHFKKEPNFDYKAVFLYADVLSIITSLYNIDRKGRFMLIWLLGHLSHLEVKKRHVIIFAFLYALGLLIRPIKPLAFAYLITNDKFRFKENMRAWSKSQNTLFIDYNALCAQKEETVEKISNYLGMHLYSFEIKPRTSNTKEIPQKLRKLVDYNYAMR